MKNFFEIHPVQIAIVDYLTYHPHARYTDLNTTGITSDHFNFHLSRLVENNLVTKNTDNTYSLTHNGKKMINALSTRSQLLYNQYKIVVVVICRTNIGKTKKILLQKRRKEPFWGVYDVLAGKVHWDETVEEASVRIIKEKISLCTKPKFSHVRHEIDKDEKGNILENIFLYVYTATIAQKEANQINGEDFLWVSEKELHKIHPLFNDIPSMTQEQKLSFNEAEYIIYDY